MAMLAEHYASSIPSVHVSLSSTSATALISDSDTEFSYESGRTNLGRNVQVAYDDMYKIVLVGGPSSGKTALLQRFCCDNFISEHLPTLGIDLKVRDIQLNGQRVKLKLWDASGEDRFRKVVESYCRGSEAAGVMVVFDVSDLESFAAAKKWITLLSEISVNLRRGWNPVRLLVANKEDLLLKRVVSRSSGEQLAIENKYLYIETSAKTGRNVVQSFNMLSSRIKHAKEKELADRRERASHTKYGPNYAKRSSSPTKFDKMNNVIKELEMEQGRVLNSFTTETPEANRHTNDTEDDTCGCFPMNLGRRRGQRTGACAIL